MSGGKLDYLPGARRPWVVKGEGKRPDGRGETVIKAVKHYRKRFVDHEIVPLNRFSGEFDRFAE